MSKMISGCAYLQTESALKNKLRKITFHPREFTSVGVDKWNHEKEERQYQFLKSMCRKFQTLQKDKIRQKSSEEIQLQLRELKLKLRHTIEQENIQKIMSEKENHHKNYVGQIIKQGTEIVDIGKKYGRQLRLQLTLLNQSDSINAQKEEYLRWYEQSKNKSSDSPNAHRLNYLLQRSKSVDKKSQLNLRSSSGQSDFLACHSQAYIKKQRTYGSPKCNSKK